jgi:hypothetical protein
VKRFLVFAGDDYYPSGGWHDLVGDFDSLEEARNVATKSEKRGHWSHIIDLTTGEKVPE